jgi:hypothetical protein
MNFLRNSAPRIRALVAALIACGAAGSVRAQMTSPVEPLIESIKGDPTVLESGLDGWVRLHHLWKAQVLAATGRAESQEKALVDTVFKPNQAFWAAYLGDEAAFTKWVRAAKPLLDDSRLDVPRGLRVGAVIMETTRRMEQLTGRRACGEWFITYGPGWTNLGGLGNGRMVFDVLGLPISDPIGDIRFVMPHELNHLLFEQIPRLDSRRSLLYRMIDEGFATFVADEYWGVGLSPAEALGYTQEQWVWAVANEQTLWREAQAHLDSTDRKVLDRFSSASQQVIAGAPGKAGYFLGYRIIEDFVRRNGPQSWRRVYGMSLAEVVSATRFASR